MANDFDTTARNVGVNAVAAVCLRVAAHTGDPGAADTAANEVTGGSPAYARKAIAWDAASGGSAALSGDVDIDIPASTTVSWLSFWNTAGTTRYFKKDVTDEAFGSQGVYTLLASGTSMDLNDA